MNNLPLKFFIARTCTWVNDNNELIPANTRHKKNKAHKTRPNIPTFENSTGILKWEKNILEIHLIVYI